MSLKLFRSTGYSSLLTPGHSRETLHPAWVVLAVSLWAGFVCNVPLWWALLSAAMNAQLTRSLVLGAVVASGCGLALSLLCWRATLKPVASAVLVFAALAAVARQSQAAQGTSLADTHLIDHLLPSWTSLLHWQVPLLLAALAIAPMAWVWGAQVKRLPGPQQLRSNLRGMAVAAAVFGAATLLLMLRGF